VPEYEGIGFSGVWGANGSDVYALGAPGIVHWDGATWSVVGSDASRNVAGVSGGIWGSGPDDVWAGGYFGILHWDGTTWSIAVDKSSIPVLSHALVAGVWGSGPADVFFLGSCGPGTDGFVLHWDGKTWSTLPIPTYEGPTGIWGTASDDVYVFGGNTGVLHWDGAAFNSLVIADGFAPATMWGTGRNDVYAVGGTGAFHWDGKAWSPADIPAATVLIGGSGPDDIYAASGVSGLSHRSGGTFFDVGSFVAGEIAAIWGDASADTFVVGPGIFAPGDGEWFPMLSASPIATWGMGDDVFFTTRAGLTHVTKSGPPQTTQFSLVSPPAIMWGTSQNDLWGLASLETPDDHKEVLRWNGTSWVSIDTSWSQPDPSIKLSDIGGTSPNDVWVVGTIVSHWDGAHWSPPEHPPSVLNGVWARSPTDVFAVGLGGRIQHWNGSAWSQMSSGITADLYGVWGTGQADVFAVGDVGVLHLGRDGVWAPMTTESREPLRRIRGTSVGNVYVSGAVNHVLYHLRAGVWEPINETSGLLGTSTDFWVTPSHVFWGGSALMQEFTYRLDLKGVDCIAPERDCTDGWDNDCDGLLDAADPDCAGKVVEQCANLADDDGDGLVDCADPDCAQFPSCRH
jgi:hypothetical protein